MVNDITQLEQLLAQSMIQKRFGFHRQLSQIKKRIQEKRPVDQSIEKLQAQLIKSCEQAQKRGLAIQDIEYDDSLPVSLKREEISAAIKDNQVVVIAGETGSGKTTQIPKICLELGLAQYGMIAHTQPRRIAARSVAQRIAQEVKVPLGEEIGYQIRFSDQSTPQTLVKLMTDGILLAETQNDRFLNKYQVIIIDEAHERSLNIDFLMGYLKQLLPKRPDLKVIITSATIDVERFSKHFNDAPVIQVSGRTFPVGTRYRPLVNLDEEGDEKEGDVYQGIVDAVEELALEDSKRGQIGDVLIFLSGEREIREAALELKKANLKHSEILPLYARLNSAEQNKIFNPSGGKRRIILSTNVAETSLTVPGIRYVIDSGVARISRYSYRSKVQRLPIEPISQASANQRKGRCGRVSEGICIRLYSEEDFNSRPEFSDPEIQRTNLAAVILQMLSLKLGDVTKFPFVDAPDNRFINDGYNLLKELGAVSKDNQINQVGRSLSRLPVDPRIARMLFEASKRKALQEMLIIAAALSIQDPRERPADKQQQADQKHAEFRHEESDFLTLLTIWQQFEEVRQESSNNQLRQYCKKHFLNYMRMREWRDVHYQLRLQCKELKWEENQEVASYEAIHQSILSGFLSYIGQKTDEGDYLGARNRRFMLFPGSGIFKKRPKWVVSAEMVETSRLYARMNARIDPEWLEPLAKNLVKRKYLEPYWSVKRGQVMAYEQVSLYGLVIIPKRTVGYAKIDPKVSHEIFIREALVQQQIKTRSDFIAYNQALIEEVEELEEKSRRRDIVVDEERLFQFYIERVPADICDTASFEKWLKTQPEDLLKVKKSYLMQHGAEHVTEAQFPDHFTHGNVVYPLNYRFEPNHLEDGVSVVVPAAMLKQLPISRIQWLVPGMLRDKVIALLKGLSKSIRRQLVPVPDFADGFLSEHKISDHGLLDKLAEYIYKHKRIDIQASDWNLDQLDSHYLMNIQVMGNDNELLVQGRNWHELIEQVGDQIEHLTQDTSNDFERDGIQCWDLNALPKTYAIEQAGIQVTLYPALIDQTKSVSLKLLPRADDAIFETQKGIWRLLQLELTEQVGWIHKEVPKRLAQEMIYFGHIGNKAQLLESVTTLVFSMCFPLEELPRTDADYQKIKSEGRGLIGEKFEEVLPLIQQILQSYHQLNKKMKQQNQLAFAMAVADIKQQMNDLMPQGFLGSTSLEWLKQYPRYFKAMMGRLDKLQGNLQKDRLLQLSVAKWQEQYQSLLAKLPANVACFNDVQTLFWMIQEYRVSLFVQELGTQLPVSEKRWKAQLELAQASIQQ
ncbi:MAG: ATP-dependent RNA helicase HrpA [Gammaproteobacteria bacterium]|nr:ATP-dependent RNA helicase HrpA [Gammaproteobacteria bacterium]